MISALLQTTGSRVIFLNVNSDQAVGLLCQVSGCSHPDVAPLLVPCLEHLLVLAYFRHLPLD